MQLDLFNGGFSDTDTLVGKGQFQYAENCEILESPEYVRLSADGEVVGPLSIANYGDSFFSTVLTGEIVNSDNDVLYTDPDGDNIVLFNTFHEYLIWIVNDSDTKYKLGAIPLSDASTTTAWSAADYTYPIQNGGVDMFFSKLTSDSKISILKFTNDILIVYSGNKVYQVIESGGTWALTEMLTMDSEIKGITQQGTYLYIYTESGIKSVWDGVSESIQGWINLKSEVNHVEEDSGYDYIFLGQDLYLSQGLTTPELVKRECIGYTPTKFIKNNFYYGDSFSQNISLDRTSTGDKGIHYILTENTSGKFQILQFGKYHPTQDFIFNIITTQINSNDINLETRGLYGGRFIVYYSGLKTGANSTVKFDYLNPTTYQTSGFIQSHKEYYGDKNLKKKVLRAELNCEVDTNNYINVYYSIDGEDWVLWKKVDSVPDGERKKLLTLSKPFYGIQVKFELIGDGTTSPKMRGFKLIPLPINDK